MLFVFILNQWIWN